MPLKSRDTPRWLPGWRRPGLAQDSRTGKRNQLNGESICRSTSPPTREWYGGTTENIHTLQFPHWDHIDLGDAAKLTIWSEVHRVNHRFRACTQTVCLIGTGLAQTKRSSGTGDQSLADWQGPVQGHTWKHMWNLYSGAVAFAFPMLIVRPRHEIENIIQWCGINQSADSSP